jgi:hypothetical protein
MQAFIIPFPASASLNPVILSSIRPHLAINIGHESTPCHNVARLPGCPQQNLLIPCDAVEYAQMVSDDAYRERIHYRELS